MHLHEIETAHDVLKKYISDDLKIEIVSVVDKGYKVVQKLMIENEWLKECKNKVI